MLSSLVPMALAVSASSRPVLRLRAVPRAVAASASAPVPPSRRDILRLQASLAVLGPLGAVTTGPAYAAYGEGANVFGGGATNASGYIPYSGDGYALLVPAKWGPSKEREFVGVELFYTDNYFGVNNLEVVVRPTNKGRIEDYGSPDDFLNEISYLLGEQSYSGETISEGGFAPNKVSKAAVLSSAPKAKKNKTYYDYELLATTADGNEGGTRYLVSATVSNGALYVLKVQAGEKRWFKGVEKLARTAQESFSVA